MPTNTHSLSDAVATHHRDVETALAEVQITVSTYRRIKALTELVGITGCFIGAGLGHIPWIVGAAVTVLVVGGVEAFDSFLARRGNAQNAEVVTEEQLQEVLDRKLPDDLGDTADSDG